MHQSECTYGKLVLFMPMSEDHARYSEIAHVLGDAPLGMVFIIFDKEFKRQGWNGPAHRISAEFLEPVE
jgi:hypothetical protein